MYFLCLSDEQMSRQPGLVGSISLSTRESVSLFLAICVIHEIIVVVLWLNPDELGVLHWSATNALYELCFWVIVPLVLGVILVLEERRLANGVASSIVV